MIRARPPANEPDMKLLFFSVMSSYRLPNSYFIASVTVKTLHFNSQEKQVSELCEPKIKCKVESSHLQSIVGCDAYDWGDESFEEASDAFTPESFGARAEERSLACLDLHSDL